MTTNSASGAGVAPHAVVSDDVSGPQAPRSDTPSTPAAPALPHMPGLDGLRGLAVAAVVVYHAGFSFMVGGYLGVSTFFTLSGFLITGLLLVELRETGKVSFRRFWNRRLRRLLPPILVTLALVTVVFGRLVATADQRANMRADVLASLFDVANWRFIAEGSGYGAATADPSPLLHFWSLAIEEQFYLVFPLLLWGLWRVSRGRSAVPAVVVVGLILLSAALPALFGMSVDRAYFGTDTRAAELLVGAALAFVLLSPGVRQWWQDRPRARLALTVAALAAATVQLYWWWTLPHGTPWLYRGGLTLYALMTALIIAAVVVGPGPMASVTSVRALRWLGTRSFAVYLIHWPLYLAVRQTFPDLPRGWQAALVILSSLAIAEASFRLFEAPIRAGRWPASHPGRFALAGVVVVVVLALMPLPFDPAQRTTDYESLLAQRSGQSQQAEPAASPPPPVKPEDAAAVPARPARVATFGDSVALLAAMGLAEYEETVTDPWLVDTGGEVVLGCGVTRYEARYVEVYEPLRAECKEWPSTWPQAIKESEPNIAMLITGAWEVTDMMLPGASDWSAVGSAATDDFVRAELTSAVDSLAADGALVMLVLWPPYAPWSTGRITDAAVRQADPARMLRLHEIMEEVAASRPDSTRVFDLSAWLGEQRLSDKGLRDDGMHIPAPVMTQLWTQGLAEAVYTEYAEWFASQQAIRSPTP